MNNSFDNYLSEYIETASREDLLLLAEAREEIITRGDRLPDIPKETRMNTIITALDGARWHTINAAWKLAFPIICTDRTPDGGGIIRDNRICRFIARIFDA